MAKTNMRRIGKVRVKRNGIIIVQRINIKTLLKMGRDGQMMVICRRFSEISRDTFGKTNCNQEYTFCHQDASTSRLKINKTHSFPYLVSQKSCRRACRVRWVRWVRWAPSLWARLTCSGDKRELGNEHPKVYATIESTSLH